MEYLFAFQLWYCELCVENRWGLGKWGGGFQKALICYFLFFEVGGWAVVGWGRKYYLWPAEIVSFSSRDLNGRNKHDSFRLVVSTGYFHVLILWAIVASDFFPFEIYKHLVLLLSSVTFAANRHADKQFYKNVYLFEILYSMKSFFY